MCFLVCFRSCEECNEWPATWGELPEAFDEPTRTSLSQGTAAEGESWRKKIHVLPRANQHSTGMRSMVIAIARPTGFITRLELEWGQSSARDSGICDNFWAVFVSSSPWFV